MKVLVALSGGVDSGVAAARLMQAGHEVIAATLLHTGGTSGGEPVPGSRDGPQDAGRVAAHLGIAHHVLDCRQAFRERVVMPFAGAYRRGLTPNPCVECNRRVRFPLLLAEAARLGCDRLATGHYARIERAGKGLHLRRGADPVKDQSYFLFMLAREQLAGIIFPLGAMGKHEVRRSARELGLPGAGRRESQDLCFAGRGGYRAFLREQFPDASRPGPIRDGSGREIGRHEGVVGFTVGQRRGLGVAVGEPRYVVAVDPDAATVVVGRAADLAAAGCRMGDVSWVAGEPPDDGGLQVKVRYRSPAVRAHLEPGEAGEWLAHFSEPRAAVAAGQAAVVYRGDEVLGGGTILGAL